LDEEWKLRRHGFIRFIIKSTLLGGFKVLTILKNDEVRQWVSDDIPYDPYVKLKIKVMFQTTN
jgi:hypothetical protein